MGKYRRAKYWTVKHTWEKITWETWCWIDEHWKHAYWTTGSGTHRRWVGLIEKIKAQMNTDESPLNLSLI